MNMERLKPTALLVDMGRDEFAVLSKLLDMTDVARLDTAMTNRKGSTDDRVCWRASEQIVTKAARARTT